MSLQVQRTKSFGVHVNRDRIACVLTNTEESPVIQCGTSLFQPLAGHANFYEYLRSTATGKIVGVELHLSSETYDEWLADLPGFEKVPPPPDLLRRWRLWFTKEPAEIMWDQILSQNPYRSKNGEILLVLQVWHLRDSEFEDLREIARQWPDAEKRISPAKSNFSV